MPKGRQLVQLAEDVVRRRVAIVTQPLKERGGVAAVVRFLINTLDRSGEYVSKIITLATSRTDVASLKLLEPSSWRRNPRICHYEWEGRVVTHVGAFGVELERQRYQPRRLLTELLDDYDIIQVVGGGAAWALVTRNARAPVVLQVATLVKMERASMLRDRAISPTTLWRRAMTANTSRLERRALAGVEKVFVENHWMFDHMTKVLGGRKVVFAPPGVDTELFHPSTVSPRSGMAYILSVGRFVDPRKNVGLLFRAYARLRQMYRAAPTLVLAGTPPTAKTWQLAVDLRIAENIVVRKDVAAAELSSLYRNALLFVLSSEEEGLGIVLLEAMASGIPVVSTDCGGPRTAVVDGHTGCLTPPGDDVALATAMQRLLADEELRSRMGMAGRRRAERFFSIETAGTKFLEVYDDVFTRSTLRAVGR